MFRGHVPSYLVGVGIRGRHIVDRNLSVHEADEETMIGHCDAMEPIFKTFSYLLHAMG